MVAPPGSKIALTSSVWITVYRGRQFVLAHTHEKFL
nr:MAG TPA: hypothetical protein [Caudoviricetes sp.]